MIDCGPSSTALVASQRAVTLANERYERGLTDFLNVVDAQREEYDIQEQYTGAQVNADEQFIAVFRSLGGGWQSYQTLPPAHIPEPAIVARARSTGVLMGKRMTAPEVSNGPNA